MTNLFEMANIRKTKTGLPFNVWIIDTQNPHLDAKIEVQQNYSNRISIDNSCSVSISWYNIGTVTGKWQLTEKDYNLLMDWILKNQYALVGVYYGNIDVQDFFETMKKV